MAVHSVWWNEATRIEGDDGFVVWSAAWTRIRDRVRDGGDLVPARSWRSGAGVALDVAGLAAPDEEQVEEVLRFVDTLQTRGVGVVACEAGGGFLTALAMDGADTRLATRSDLTAAVATLRQYEELRIRSATDRGQRVNHLRMPAEALSLAPLCAYARHRLTEAVLPEDVVFGLLEACHDALCETLGQAFEPGEGDLSLSVTVHAGRATLTLLDAGKPREAGVEHPPAPSAVDRIHRFRILDQHNAVVLERDLGEVATA